MDRFVLRMEYERGGASRREILAALEEILDEVTLDMAGQSRHAATLDLRESDGPSPDLSTNLSPRTNSLGVDDLFSISVRDSGSGLDPQLSTLLIDLGVGISAGLGVEFLKTLWSSEILRRLRQEVGSDAVGRRLSIRVEQVSDEGIRHTRVDVIEEG